MKLTLASRNQNLIRGYAAGEVRVNDRIIHCNCLITPEQIIAGWSDCSASNLSNLSVGDTQSILAQNPEVVILGTGSTQQFPSAEIYAVFLERNIGFEVMDLGAACRTFNILLGEDRRVIAALLLQ